MTTKAPETLFDETVLVIAWRGPSSALAARWGMGHDELLRRLRVHGVKRQKKIILEIVSDVALTTAKRALLKAAAVAD